MMGALDFVQCQSCHGAGGVRARQAVPLQLDDGTGPWVECNCCWGTGETTERMNIWIWLWTMNPFYQPGKAAMIEHLAAMAARKEGRQP